MFNVLKFALIAVMVLSAGNAFAIQNDRSVVSPYWQADGATYTFIGVSHPSLSGMATRIGVSLQVLLNSGIANGAFLAQGESDANGKLDFTIDRNSTKRIFIAATNNSVFNPTVFSDGLVVVNSPASGHGNLRFSPASNPKTCVSAVTGHCGFPDITMLNMWGVVVVQSSSTGFAMEFVGDSQDSRAWNTPNFSGVN